MKLKICFDIRIFCTTTNYGNLLSKLGRNEEAEDQYKLALASDPNDLNIHLNYGNLLYELGRNEGAEDQYKLALASDPNDLNTHYKVLLQK